MSENNRLLLSLKREKSFTVKYNNIKNIKDKNKLPNYSFMIGDLNLDFLKKTKVS